MRTRWSIKKQKTLNHVVNEKAVLKKSGRRQKPFPVDVTYVHCQPEVVRKTD